MGKFVSAKLEGEKNAIDMFDEVMDAYPKRVSVNGIKKAVEPFQDALSNFETKPVFKQMAGSKVFDKRKSKGVNPIVGVGMFSRKKFIHRKDKNGKTDPGKYVSAWFAYYWRDYGTLSNRFWSYGFNNARKAVSMAMKGGIRARNNSTKAWTASRSAVVAGMPGAIRNAAEKEDARIQRKLNRQK